MKKKTIAVLLAAVLLTAAAGVLLYWQREIGRTVITSAAEPEAQQDIPQNTQPEPADALPDAELSAQVRDPAPDPEPETAPVHRGHLPETPAKCVVIDAGHQQNADYGTEPLGPGSSEMKTRVAAGTTGVSTGTPEYELNLAVSLLLEQELTSRGYRVVMVRTENDVSISNAERAAVANDEQADAFIRVHANGSESSAASGIMTICMTPYNPYNGALYEKSHALSDCILTQLGAALGKPESQQTLWQTDTMTGINYSQVPVTIVEMGFMTNPEEDAAMATEEYRQKIAAGIADGVDRYFMQFPPETLTEDPALAETLREQISTSAWKWDIWAEQLGTGIYAHVQQNVDHAAPQMISASLIKLFIMGAVYDAERRGDLPPGAQEDAIRKMIAESDNDAANDLTRLLGGGDEAAGRGAVEAFAASLGCSAVRYERLMLVENGLQNEVTAEDCARFLRLVYGGQCVSQEASERMMEHLLAQEVNDRIPQGLPSGVQSAHKTGDLLGLCCADVGIVLAPQTDLLLCLICNGQTEQAAAAGICVELTRAAVRYFGL